MSKELSPEVAGFNLADFTRYNAVLTVTPTDVDKLRASGGKLDVDKVIDNLGHCMVVDSVLADFEAQQ